MSNNFWPSFGRSSESIDVKGDFRRPIGWGGEKFNWKQKLTIRLIVLSSTMKTDIGSSVQLFRWEKAGVGVEPTCDTRIVYRRLSLCAGTGPQPSSSSINPTPHAAHS